MERLDQRKISFRAHTVVKSDYPDRMAIEVEKTKRAYEIGKSTGCFRVPRVVDSDADNGIGEFERLESILSIRTMISSGSMDNELARDIGRALAIVHRYMDLPVNMKRPLPLELWLPETDAVFIHGDYNISNVCYDAENKKVAILDWQMTSYYGGNSTYGTKYFDMSFFVNSIFKIPWIKFYRPIPDYITQFIDGYYETLDGQEYPDFIAYLKYFTKINRKLRKATWNWKEVMLYMPMDYYLKRTIDAL